MNAITMLDCVDAGKVAPSPRQFRVVCNHNHPTLRVYDVVVMVETPKSENLLLRLSDMTLHTLQDEADQYVHLEPLPVPERVSCT